MGTVWADFIPYSIPPSLFPLLIPHQCRAVGMVYPGREE